MLILSPRFPLAILSHLFLLFKCSQPLELFWQSSLNGLGQTHSFNAAHTLRSLNLFFSPDLSAEFDTNLTTSSPLVCAKGTLNSAGAKLKMASFFTNPTLIIINTNGNN